jgi:hypothetical protein
LNRPWATLYFRLPRQKRPLAEKSRE